MNLFPFKLDNVMNIFCYTEEQTVEYYNNAKLFFNEICPICEVKMNYRSDCTKSFTTRTFQCPICNQILSKRSGTIFEGMKIHFKTFNLIVYYFADGFTIQQIYRLLKPLGASISLNTVRKYTKTIRLLIHLYIQESLSNLILPGPVEIDEACCYKIRRGDHGRLAKTIYWVFGLKCRTTKQVIIYPVLYRNRKTIIPIIRKHILPGTIIYSDMFSCYFNNRVSPPESYLQQFGYIHYGINHSIEFVSKIDASIHTNTIERVWRGLKGKLREYKPRKYIDEYISQYIMESLVPKYDRYFFIIALLHKFQNE